MVRKRVDIDKIKRMRKSSRITLEEMAKHLGYKSPNGYYYLERGRSKFTAETLAEVADILGAPMEDLFLDTRQ
ncbi:MAG TPA: helix-turn-helix transcriptional regulator [Bacillales bacterium]|nr:helix-turn-helix transcriptional regulator [Bacillales bacterium]